MEVAICLIRSRPHTGPSRSTAKIQHKGDQHASVKVLVRWAKDKRLTNCLPNLSLITLSPPGTDPILTGRRATTRGSNFWGSRSLFQVLDRRKLT